MNEANKIVDAYKMEEMPRGGRRSGLPKPRINPPLSCQPQRVPTREDVDVIDVVEEWGTCGRWQFGTSREKAITGSSEDDSVGEVPCDEGDNH